MGQEFRSGLVSSSGLRSRKVKSHMLARATACGRIHWGCEICVQGGTLTGLACWCWRWVGGRSPVPVELTTARQLASSELVIQQSKAAAAMPFIIHCLLRHTRLVSKITLLQYEQQQPASSGVICKLATADTEIERAFSRG